MFNPRNNVSHVLDYLDNDLTSWIRIPEKDMQRPGIAVSFVHAALHLDRQGDLLEDAKDVEFFMVNFHGHMDPVKYPNWTNWAIAARVITHAGEIREAAFDGDLYVWTAPWFDLESGLVVEANRFKA